MQCICSFLEDQTVSNAGSAGRRRVFQARDSLKQLGLHLISIILHTISSLFSSTPSSAFKSEFSLSCSLSSSLDSKIRSPLHISPTIIDFFADDVSKHLLSILRSNDLRSIREALSLFSLMFTTPWMMPHLQCQLELFLKGLVFAIYPRGVMEGKGSPSPVTDVDVSDSIFDEKKEILLSALLDYFEVFSFLFLIFFCSLSVSSKTFFDFQFSFSHHHRSHIY